MALWCGRARWVWITWIVLSITTRVLVLRRRRGLRVRRSRATVIHLKDPTGTQLRHLTTLRRAQLPGAPPLAGSPVVHPPTQMGA